MGCILSFLRYNVFSVKLMTLFSDSIMATPVIITNFPRDLQRKSDKLEMSKMFYFIYLMLMKSGIEYFFRFL